MSIPLPKLLLAQRKYRTEIRPALDPERGLWWMFREMMGSRSRYETAANLARGVQSIWPGGAKKMVIPGWTDRRDAPVFAKRPFRELFDSAEGEEGEDA